MTPGFHSITSEAYHRDPCDEPSLSSGIANLLLNRSPLHARYAHSRLNPAWRPREPNNDMDAGTVAHMLMLEGHHDRVTIIDANDYRSNAAKEARDSARAIGNTPILRNRFLAIQEMVDAGREQIGKLKGNAEQCIVWKEGEIWCRALLDLWDEPTIYDYKTTDNAEPNSFARRLFQMGYDVQSAFYERGIRAVTGKDCELVFLVQETEAPYLVSRVALDNDARELADRKVQTAIDIWTRCMQTGKWPGYYTAICYAQAPGWAVSQWEESAAVRIDLGGVA